MKDYARILVAIDFSHNSEAAVQRGIKLAGATGARFLLLHVVEHFPTDVPIDHIAPEGADTAEYLLRRGHESLDALAKRFGCAAAEQNVILSLRGAKNEILQFADEQKADLIVLGAHSRHGIADLLGSTASGVVNNAPCDVLVARAG